MRVIRRRREDRKKEQTFNTGCICRCPQVAGRSRSSEVDLICRLSSLRICRPSSWPDLQGRRPARELHRRDGRRLDSGGEELGCRRRSSCCRRRRNPRIARGGALVGRRQGEGQKIEPTVVRKRAR